MIRARLYRRGVLDEVPGQGKAEGLRLACLLAVLLGVGVDRVLRGVGREALAVVAVVVDLVEVADERDADVVVDELVRVAVAIDADDSGLGLSVLVVSERDAHG